MKKFISLALSLVLVCSLGTTAFAAEITNDTEQQSAQSELVYNLDTSYCIMIPEQIDASTGAYTFEAGYINVSEAEQVTVRMSGVDEVSCLSLYNENGDELRCGVSYNNSTITHNYVVAEFTDSVMANGALQINPQLYGTAHRTGAYSGIFEFTVSVEPRT